MGVAKGGPKKERTTYKCAKKLWKSGEYLFQSEEVTEQHMILLIRLKANSYCHVFTLGNWFKQNAECNLLQEFANVVESITLKPYEWSSQRRIFVHNNMSFQTKRSLMFCPIFRSTYQTCTAPEMIPTPKWSPNRPRNDPQLILGMKLCYEKLYCVTSVTF